MAQEFVYSVLARPTLGSGDLVYRRRVMKASSSDNSKNIASEEHRYETDNDSNEFTGYLPGKKRAKKNNDPFYIEICS